MAILLSCGVIGVVLLSAALGSVYHLVFSPIVRAHFGEEFRSHRDRDATRRRQGFERRCGQAATFIYFSMIAGITHGMEFGLIPDLARIALVAQIVAFLIGFLYVWAAVICWREPFEN